jgi:hypothetical protein
MVVTEIHRQDKSAIVSDRLKLACKLRTERAALLHCLELTAARVPALI